MECTQYNLVSDTLIPQWIKMLLEASLLQKIVIFFSCDSSSIHCKYIHWKYNETANSCIKCNETATLIACKSVTADHG